MSRSIVRTARLRRVAAGMAAAAALGACSSGDREPATAAVAVVQPPPAAEALPPVRRADFRGEQPGDDARRIADWVVDSGDNGGAPFLVIDKIAARAYAFDAAGALVASAPVLLGLARGDHTAPGVGDKPLAAVRVDERTTAAGRFVAEIGYNLRGEDVLWIDYDSGLSLHRVLTTNREERRAERLATPTPLDNRVSYGCINVPVAFFEEVIGPAYRGRQGVVYVLPEKRSALAFFGAYDVDERAKTRTAQAERLRLPGTVR